MSSNNELPFNKLNIVLSHTDLVNKLLVPFGHDGQINDINIFRKAFVHRSYCVRKNENCVSGNVACPADCLVPLQEESNERIEFLGDAVVGIVIGHYLFERFPDDNEGFLTKMRTKLVNGTMLGHLAEILDLGKWVILSKQIEESEGRRSVRILEDCFEAFVGAMFLDNGSKLDRVTTWIIGLIEQNLDFSELIVANNNHKDTMIKHYQHTYGYVPKFFDMGTEVCEGVKFYLVCAKDKNDQVIGTGRGKTKKLAENDCAYRCRQR
jgi:ribonuclease-3